MDRLKRAADAWWREYKWGHWYLALRIAWYVVITIVQVAWMYVQWRNG